MSADPVSIVSFLILIFEHFHSAEVCWVLYIVFAKKASVSSLEPLQLKLYYFKNKIRE